MAALTRERRDKSPDLSVVGRVASPLRVLQPETRAGRRGSEPASGFSSPSLAADRLAPAPL
eukprot:3396775-Prymnesium_polylepis.1